LIELRQNIVGSGFLRHRPSHRSCCYGNHAALQLVLSQF